MEKKMLVEGMSCNHCKMSVEKAISAVPGVSACVVDLANKTATITLREDVADENSWRPCATPTSPLSKCCKETSCEQITKKYAA